MLNTRQKRKILALVLAAAWLYTFSLLYQLLAANNDNPRKTISRFERYVHSAEKDFQQECSNIPNILRLSSRTYDEALLKRFAQKPYAVFVYRDYGEEGRQLSFWSNNYALPAPAHFSLPESGSPVTLDNGLFEFCHKNLQVNDTRITVACLIPLQWDYFIENDYLKKNFAGVPGMGKRYEVAATNNIYPVKNGAGEILFYLAEKESERNTGYSSFVMVTRLLCLVLLIALVCVLANAVGANRSYRAGLLVLFAGLLLLRLLTWYFPFPFNRSRLEIFDPHIYASGRIIPSLGDFVFNIVLLFILTLYIVRRPIPIPRRQRRTLLAIGFTLALVVFTLLCGFLLRSLIIDSKISFNVTNFFSLDQYSLIGFIAVTLLVLSYYYLSVYLLQHIMQWAPHGVLPYLATAAGGLFILFLGFPIFSNEANLFILIWLTGYILLYQLLQPAANINRTVFREDIVMLLFFSISTCILFTHENNKKELNERKILADTLAFRAEPSTENLLSITIGSFDNNFLVKNQRRWEDAATGQAYKDSLINHNFIGSLNKFDTRIYTYDSLGNPVNNNGATSLDTFSIVVQTTAIPLSNIPDLYYNEAGFDLYNYIYYKRLQDTAGLTLGYFVIDMRPLKYKTNNNALDPVLLQQKDGHFYEKLNNYVYAVYRNLQLRKRFIDYDFPVEITPAQVPVYAIDSVVHRNGYDELWHKSSSDVLVVMGKKNNTLIATVTLFAYLFFALLLLTTLYRLLYYLVTRPPGKWLHRGLLQFSIRNQVQGIIIMASLVSFIVIGIAFISLFKARFDKNNKNRLAAAMGILVSDVQNKLSNNAIFDDVVKVYEPGASPQLEQMVYQLSEIHNTDFSVYDLDGLLRLSSQPFVRNKGLMGNRMNPVAYFQLSKRGSGQLVQEEQIGSLHYLSMYVPVRDELGNAYAYLNIPYYASGNDLKQEISNFLLTIININAFVFLIAGLIAWLITNRITRSFLLIGEKMKEVNLGRNEEITWKRNDEIGDLVKKYNEMVRKLEASAAKLAKSEREGAWREMARQVAHEIKNPLTPMKLSIQFLEKSIANGSENIQDLATSVTQTLVEQIDHLSKIAADFSQFANIGNTKAEPIALHDMLEKTAGLFSVEPGAEISVTDQFTTAVIRADKTQVNRLFTNLLKNALQSYATEAHRPVELGIVQVTEGFATVRVRDFGAGIPEEMRSKIFTPNFTTKTSGTGLGLAISKGIAEQAGGDIWFETGEGGTTFFVSLPLAEKG